MACGQTRTQAEDQFPAVVVVGDLILDIYSAVERQPDTVESPVYLEGTERRLLGGAARVGRYLSDLGVASVVAGLSGRDEDGRLVQRLAEAERHLTLVRVQDESRPTTSKLRIVEEGSVLLRIDRESRRDAETRVEDRLMTSVEPLLSDSSILVLSDYGKGCLTRRVTDRLLTRAQALSVEVVVDPVPGAFQRYSGADLVCPNEAEATAAADMGSVPDVATLAGRLRELLPSTNIAVTLAERGACLLQVGQERPERIQASAVEPLTVSGAGDAFVAGYVAARIAGDGRLQSCRTAVSVASDVVGRPAAAPARWPIG